MGQRDVIWGLSALVLFLSFVLAEQTLNFYRDPGMFLAAHWCVLDNSRVNEYQTCFECNDLRVCYEREGESD